MMMMMMIIIVIIIVIMIMQWIPSHCGILGNEKADGLAKKGTEILQDINGRNAILHCSLHDSSNYL